MTTIKRGVAMNRYLKITCSGLTSLAITSNLQAAEVGSLEDIDRQIAALELQLKSLRERRALIAPPPAALALPFALDMVSISPGSFKMGSKETEDRREIYEGPRQDVDINYSFEVSKYEITFDQWDACVEGGGCGAYSPEDGDWGRGNRPVINVSWDDAQLFISWLNEKTGKFYRLLSESEWEYVARAGTTTAFYTGKMITSDDANFNGTETYKGSPVGIYLRKTAPVGSYAANPFGIHDIIGNAFEWTQDCWSDSHKGNPNDGLPRIDGDCKFRVMKGGSWVNHPFQLRAAKRTKYVTDYRYDDYGFRIARTVK